MTLKNLHLIDLLRSKVASSVVSQMEFLWPLGKKHCSSYNTSLVLSHLSHRTNVNNVLDLLQNVPLATHSPHCSLATSLTSLPLYPPTDTHSHTHTGTHVPSTTVHKIIFIQSDSGGACCLCQHDAERNSELLRLRQQRQQQQQW